MLRHVVMLAALAGPALAAPKAPLYSAEFPLAADAIVKPAPAGDWSSFTLAGWVKPAAAAPGIVPIAGIGGHTLCAVDGQAAFCADGVQVPPSLVKSDSYMRDLKADAERSALLIKLYSVSAKIVVALSMKGDKIDPNGLINVLRETAKLKGTMDLETFQDAVKRSNYAPTTPDMQDKFKLVNGTPGQPSLAICKVVDNKVGVVAKLGRVVNKAVYNALEPYRRRFAQ